MNNRLIRLECLRIALSKGYADDSLKEKVDEYAAIVLDGSAASPAPRRSAGGRNRKSPDTPATS